MCGISVIVVLERKTSAQDEINGTPPGDSDKAGSDSEARRALNVDLISSLDQIAYRGPDARAVWINPDNTVGKNSHKTLR